MSKCYSRSDIITDFIIMPILIYFLAWVGAKFFGLSFWFMVAGGAVGSYGQSIYSIWRCRKYGR